MEIILQFLVSFVVSGMSWFIGVMVPPVSSSCWQKRILHGKMKNTSRLLGGALNWHGNEACCTKGLVFVMGWLVSEEYVWQHVLCHLFLVGWYVALELQENSINTGVDTATFS